MSFNVGDIVRVDHDWSDDLMGATGEVTATGGGNTKFRVTDSAQAWHSSVGDIRTRSDERLILVTPVAEVFPHTITYAELQVGDRVTVESVRTTQRETRTRTFTATVAHKYRTYAETDTEVLIANLTPDMGGWDTETITLLWRAVPKFDPDAYRVGTVIRFKHYGADATGVKRSSIMWTVVYTGEGNNAAQTVEPELLALLDSDAVTILLEG